MKKLVLIVIIFTLAFTSCDLFGKKTTLTIKNESGFEITHVLWNNISFTNNQSENSIKPGTSVTMEVEAGSGYIRFRPKLNPYNTRTAVLITVEQKADIEFIFISNTMVTRDGVSASNGTLASFASNAFSGEIGSTGPGGGKIFFADGGSFIECSGELGTYNWNDAVKRCKSHNGGGFNDWRLPDRGEVALMLRNRTSLGFRHGLYWSSTIGAGGQATIFNFSDVRINNIQPGDSGYSGYNSIANVRAVRSFSIY